MKENPLKTGKYTNVHSVIHNNQNMVKAQHTPKDE